MARYIKCLLAVSVGIAAYVVLCYWGYWLISALKIYNYELSICMYRYFYMPIVNFYTRETDVDEGRVQAAIWTLCVLITAATFLLAVTRSVVRDGGHRLFGSAGYVVSWIIILAGILGMTLESIFAYRLEDGVVSGYLMVLTVLASILLTNWIAGLSHYVSTFYLAFPKEDHL